VKNRDYYREGDFFLLLKDEGREVESLARAPIRIAIVHRLSPLTYIECLARAGELEKAQLLLGTTGVRRTAPGELPTGIHTSGTDQRSNLSRSNALRRSRGVALVDCRKESITERM